MRGLAVLAVLFASLVPAAGAAAVQHPRASAAVAAAATNDLGFDLQRRAGAGNVALSPWSAWSALTMPYAGARGQTRAQMVRVLHAGAFASRAGTAQRSLARALRRSAQASGARLESANALWGERTSAFRTPFLDLLAHDYGAPLEREDFKGDFEGARGRINGWVADHTAGHITDLFPPGSITDLTRLVLANALYFKASWAAPFAPEDTRDATFHAPGRDVQAPTMSGSAAYPYARVGKLDAISLPYKGKRLSMLILLPETGALRSAEQSLTAARLRRIAHALKPAEVDLSMPRFRVTTELSLNDALSGLGMPRAFSDRAQFGGISSAEPLHIQAVVHKGWIEVGEKGTEAAAATGISVGATSAVSPPPKRVAVDRPFLFAVRDDTTGAVLFSGRVEDPTEAAK